MRRERYQASSPAASRPSRPASASRSIRSLTRWLDVGLRRRDDDRADRRASPRKIGFATARYVPVRARRRELERQRLARLPVDRLDRQPLQPGDVVLAREDARADEVDLVAGRELEILARAKLRRAAVVRRCRSSLRPRSSRGAATPVASRLQRAERLVVREALEELDGDHRRHHPRQRDAREEDQRQADTQGVHVGCYVFVVSLRASFAGETL